MGGNMPWVLMALMVIAFIAVFVFAAKRFSKTERLKREFYEKAARQRENMLNYGDASPDILRSAPAFDMIEGIASFVQNELADCAVPNEEFKKQPVYRQYAYAAYYFLSDSRTALSAFFRNSAEPLLSTAVECVRKTGMSDIVRPVELEYEMLDDDNDAVSVDEAKLSEWNAEFAAADISELTERLKQVVLNEI